MAPPKRKSGGRVTPKGTRPGDRPATSANDDSNSNASSSSTARAADEGPRRGVDASSRYTPKQTKRQLIPPSYIPVIMLVLLIGGGLLIMARYLVFTESNWPTLVGLALILGGLYTATKWQ
ncbi:MAG: hypothetical protein AAGF73_07320 [Actinomycetota bacterium]